MNIYLHFYPLEIICCYTYSLYIHPGVKWAYLCLLGEMFEWWLYALLYCTTISATAISRHRSEFRSNAADSIYTVFLVPQQMWSKISFLNFLTPLCQFTVLLLLFLVSTKSYELLGIVVVLWRSLWLFLNLINTDTKWSQKIVPRCKMLQWLDLKEK